MNICNLLRYDIRDIQYQYRMQNAALSAQQNLATQDVHATDPKLSLETKHPQIRQDSTDFFASIGLFGVGELMADAAERGRQAALEATGNYNEIGRQMGRIEKDVTPVQVYRQRQFAQPRPSLVVKSAEPIHLSCTPGEVRMQFTPAEVRIDWNTERALRRYTPSQFDFEVLQPPAIDITYLGGFQYIPQSAAPGFDRLA